MKTTFILLFAILLFSSKLMAEIDYPITPESIQEQIQLRGLAEVHDEIFSQPAAANMFLLAIDSAEPDWLEIAEMFLREQNWVSGPRLLMAIGEGLQWHPENVLQRTFPLSKICSLEGLYEWRRLSLFLSETALQRRLKALEDLAKTNEKAKNCTQIIINTREKLSSTLSNSLQDHQRTRQHNH